MTTHPQPQQASSKKLALQIPGRTTWQVAQQVAMTIIAASLIGLSYALLWIPFDLAAGGAPGVAILLSPFVPIPEGVMIFLINIPLLIIGFYYIGRWQFLGLTLLAVVVTSATTDAFAYYLPSWMGQRSVTDDPLLAAVYGGILAGIGYGLIYRIGGTPGGSTVLARILQKYTGVPLSQAFLYIDGLIVLASVFVFGWETSLLAMLVLYLVGTASDYMLEGPSRIRTATIVTNHPERVAHALMEGLNKSVSRWDVTGTYSGHWRTMLFCTIYRSQMADLKLLLNAADPTAFVTIGTAHQAFGTQFQQFRERMMQRDRMQAADPARATADALRATPLVPAAPSIPAMATTSEPALEVGTVITDIAALAATADPVLETASPPSVM